MTSILLRRFSLIACWLFFSNSNAFPAVPQLDFVFPAGGQRGTQVTTTCHGKFDWPVEVRAAGVDVQVGKKKGELTFKIPPNLPTDRIWIQLFNAEGISTVRPFLINGLAEHLEKEPNNRTTESNAIELPAVVNGVLHKRGEVDCFSVELEKDATLVAAIDANTRLGSPMDAMLQIVTPDGIVLAENHDTVGLDPRLTFSAPKSGSYVVRFFAFSSTPNTTIAYQGGSNYVYRLALTTGPFITHSAPLSIEKGKMPSVEPKGWNIKSDRTISIVPLGDGQLPAEFESGDRRLLTSTEIGLAMDGEYANSTRVRIHPIEFASPVISDSKNIFSLPFSVVKEIDDRKQTHEHHLRLTKGQPVVIAVESVSLHSPLVPLVRLKDPQGKVVTEVLERGVAQDAILAHTAAADGEFVLSVRDRYRHGGPGYFYRLTGMTQATDFDLSLDRDQIVVTHDKPAEVVVSVKRRSGTAGDVGPIEIDALDLPQGVTTTKVVSETSGDSAAKVTLKFSSSGPPFSGPIRIFGKSNSPHPIVRHALTPAQFGVHFDSIWLTVISAKK